MTTPQLTSRLRGGGCGVLVGGLAVAAHGIGGGGVPKSAEIALLLLVSLTAGMFAAGAAAERAGLRTHSYRRPATLRTAAALLGGQWAGHFALSATLDHHGLLHLPSLPMIAAHLVAAGACAALILVAERLYLVASSVIRAVLSGPAALAHRTVRWFAAVAVARGARPRGVRCPRAPPLFA
ncbi:hypothetical protein [Nocardia salmonicida]|uniref:hypothetical protein n=1 Tax=Nocardia salmonicida TaxID=53431 RepID=UPI0007A3C1E6|nr:hypothetical protein [Nocardia salmonicida]